MARHRLTDRVQALEGRTEPNEGPAVWIVAKQGETTDQAQARYEAEQGSLASRWALIWQPVYPGSIAA